MDRLIQQAARQIQKDIDDEIFATIDRLICRNCGLGSLRVRINPYTNCHYSYSDCDVASVENVMDL